MRNRFVIIASVGLMCFVSSCTTTSEKRALEKVIYPNRAGLDLFLKGAGDIDIGTPAPFKALSFRDIVGHDNLTGQMFVLLDNYGDLEPTEYYLDTQNVDVEKFGAYIRKHEVVAVPDDIALLEFVQTDSGAVGVFEVKPDYGLVARIRFALDKNDVVQRLEIVGRGERAGYVIYEANDAEASSKRMMPDFAALRTTPATPKTPRQEAVLRRVFDPKKGFMRTMGKLHASEDEFDACVGGDNFTGLLLRLPHRDADLFSGNYYFGNEYEMEIDKLAVYLCLNETALTPYDTAIREFTETEYGIECVLDAKTVYELRCRMRFVVDKNDTLQKLEIVSKDEDRPGFVLYER